MIYQREEILNKLSQSKQLLQSKYNINKLGLFGSYAKNEQNENSDIDVIVELSKPIGLDFVSLADDIQNLFDTKVEVISKGALNDRKWQFVKDDILYV